jgi:hypothetical protein
MINTVFYFADSENEYLNKYRNNQVSPYTIALCKDTHSLWKDGERYGFGTTSVIDDVYTPYDDTEIQRRLNEAEIELRGFVSDLSGILGDIDQNSEDIATIVRILTGDESNVSIVTKLGTWKAGLVTKSYVDGAVTGLVSSDALGNTLAGFLSKAEFDEAKAGFAAKSVVDEDHETLAAVVAKATGTEAAISAMVDASTDTVTASKVWTMIANDSSVISAMRGEFATTVDGTSVSSVVKESIAQDMNQASWNQWMSYVTGGITSAVDTTSYVNANKATWE